MTITIYRFTADTIVRRLGKEEEEANDRMRAALLAAAEQFERYAAYHMAKNPSDVAKAEANTAWVARCRDAAKTPDTVA